LESTIVVMNKNPFPLASYSGSESFCGRIAETKQLTDALLNGRNTLLFSLRRMGKTSLILHVFGHLYQQNSHKTVYVDIMNTHSVDDFLSKLGTAILNINTSKSKKMLSVVLNYLKSFNPVITFDSITGVPSVEFKSNSVLQSQQSFDSLLSFLESQPFKVSLAIDEFQQITHYSDKGFEAFLRSKIQHLKNVSFIFSGSQQQLLSEMFSSPSRPFYQSVDYLKLERIPASEYARFILERLKSTGKDMDPSLAMETLEWLDGYTFYVQNFYNKLWFLSGKLIGKHDVEETKRQLLMEREYIYTNLPNLLTPLQYKLIKGIAHETKVEQPNSKQFILKYQLGTASTVNSAIKSLIEKEIIYYEHGGYKIYDVFLWQYLRTSVQ